MLLGAAIGAVVGLAIYFVQQQNLKKKANAETIDADVTEIKEESEQENTEA